MATPWYKYPIDSAGGGYGEILDPVCSGGRCDYLKPDTNIAVPGGTPITALGSGTVTDVHDYGAGGGGLSVTVKLDNAINGLAKYESYNYLGSATTRIGQTVNPGQQIGIAGSPYGINTAFALGSDPRWGGPGFSQNARGNPLLDPRQVLTGATGSGGILGTPVDTTGGVTNPSFITGITEHVFVFLLALVLIIVGFIIIARPTVEAGRGAFL